MTGSEEACCGCRLRMVKRLRRAAIDSRLHLFMLKIKDQAE